MAAASQDNSGLLTDQTIPQWKRELILRRRAQSRTLPAGNTTVKLTCPSVVTAVRQAESVPLSLGVAAGENVSAYQQRCISTTISTNKGSLDQAQADFHSGGRNSSASSSVGENMRLVEHEAAPGSLMINGVGCDSNISIDQLNYRSRMGEEKAVKKTCASNNRKMDNNGVLKSAMVHRDTNNCSHPGEEEEPHSDSSEELQYGPGIVMRLKSKYMSMTLRESHNKGVRPSLSNMRRATSLENMLDSDETGKPPLLIKPQHKFTKRTEATSTTNKSQYISQHQQRYRSVSRGNDSMKRARSVEALLRYDTKLQSTPNQQMISVEKLLVKSISRDEIVIVEKSVPAKTEDKPPIPQPTATRNKKRAVMNASQKAGLPPPDVVKQTLKLFENSQAKSCSPVAKVSCPSPPPAPIGKLNISVANQAKPSVGPNKPLLSPKPSPEKIRRSPLVKTISPKRAPPPIPTNVPSPLPVSDVPQTTAVSDVPQTTAVSTLPSRVLPLDIPAQSPSASSFPSPRLKSPSPTNNTQKTILSSSNVPSTTSPTPPLVKPRTPSPVSKLRSPSPVSRVRTPSPVSKPQVPSPSLQTAPVTNGRSSPKDELLSSEEDLPDNCVKPVSDSSLENIRKDSSTVHYSFSNNTSSDKSKSYLPGGKSHPPPVSKVLPKTSPPVVGRNAQSPSLPPRNPIPMSPLPVLKSPDTPTHTKQVGVIRPIVSTKMQSPSLTDREIEKNLINRVKSSPIEQPTKVVVSLKPSEIVVGNVSDSVKGRLGMDECSMKEMVKSAKETNGAGLWDKKKPWNQQQNTMVFNFSGRKDPVPDYIENDGLILRSKREKIKPGDSGIILLDPSVEESSTDYDDDLSTGFTGPPSPCNVLFEGDNILINGRSNLRKQPKQRKLRITFNDNATTMFEYPSEASLITDTTASGSVSSPDMAVAGSLPAPSPLSTSAPGLPTPIGGSSLASYTPSKVSMGSEEFQLGVTRTTPLPKPKESVEPSTQPSHGDESDYLKPAEDADNVVWSADTNDDLLF